MKFEINFTSCSKNGNEITRGTAECNFAIMTTTRGIYPKISLLPVVLSQINTIASFVKVKISSDFQTRFHDEYALPTPARHAVKVESRSGLTLLCIGRRLTHFPAE